MAIFTGDHLFLPQSISSKNRLGLERAIQRLQAVNKTEYRFISFYFDTEKKEHVAWFYKRKTEEETISEVLNERSEK